MDDTTCVFPQSAASTTRSKFGVALELCIGVALLLSAIWSPHEWHRQIAIAAVLWLLCILFKSTDGWKSMGLRVTNFRAFWVVGVALLVAAAAITVALCCHTLDVPPGPVEFLQSYGGYTLWSFAQQFLLLNFLLLRLLHLISGRRAAVTIAALIFSLAHLPNAVLISATFIWGLAACLLFLRYRNIYSLALAHAIFGICLAITIPRPVTHNMRVGASYYRYHPAPIAAPVQAVNNAPRQQPQPTTGF